MTLGFLLICVAILIPGCDARSAQQSEPGEEASTAAAELDDGVVEIAFDGTAAMILPVHINGEGPLDFALDTGSTLTCVDRAVAERMDLPAERGRRGVTAGAAGVGQISVVRLDSIRVGDASMQSLDACVVNLGHARQVGVEIEGLIGLNFLRAYLVEIDFDRRVIRLRQ